MSEIDKDGHYKDESDTRVDDQGKDKVETEQFNGSNDHRFMSDKPGTKDDSQLVWDEDWTQSKQKEEFEGKGVYDLHEETSQGHTVQAKVDGDQGWKEFEDDMDDFDDTFFTQDADWKNKMQDPRWSAATATATAAGLGVAATPGPMESGIAGIEARDAQTMSPRMTNIGIATVVLLSVLIALMVGCCAGKGLRSWWVARRERAELRRYMRQMEGFHSIDVRDRAGL